MTRYSVAILPPDVVIEQVSRLKERLRAAAGWYHSVHAQAHITFNVFETGDGATLRLWEACISGFTALQTPLPLRFDRTDAFTGGAFFLAPDEASRRALIRMMKVFHLQAPFRAPVTSGTPHMSIGRKLRPDQLTIARNLIGEVDIRFVCCELVLRRFNEARRQYDVYKRFSFGEDTV